MISPVHMIDNGENNINGWVEGGKAILLRSGRRGLILVLRSATDKRGGSGKQQNWCKTV